MPAGFGLLFPRLVARPQASTSKWLSGRVLDHPYAPSGICLNHDRPLSGDRHIPSNRRKLRIQRMYTDHHLHGFAPKGQLHSGDARSSDGMNGDSAHTAREVLGDGWPQHTVAVNATSQATLSVIVNRPAVN